MRLRYSRTVLGGTAMNKQELIETLEEIRANIDRDAEIGDRTVFSQG